MDLRGIKSRDELDRGRFFDEVSCLNQRMNLVVLDLVLGVAVLLETSD